MINRNAANLLLVISLMLSGACFAQDYAARYKQLQEQKADAQLEPLLNEWRAKMPNDPEAWTTSANYYFNQRQVMLSTKPPEKGDLTLKDAKTGTQAGSISFEQQSGSVKRAAELLKEATTKFPERLDIWCGLAFIYQEMGDFNDEMSTLQKMVAYARGHPKQLKWLKGEPLDESPDTFVPEKLHGYVVYYEKKNTLEDGKRFLQIATLAADQYPNHPYAFNDVASFYSNTSDWKKAREWLEKANKIDPKSTIVLSNLGAVCAQIGDVASARKYYEAVVTLEPTGMYTLEAKEALRQLKKQ
jgi:tetratricopeptide (TPR) repeat protein